MVQKSQDGAGANDDTTSTATAAAAVADDETRRQRPRADMSEISGGRRPIGSNEKQRKCERLSARSLPVDKPRAQPPPPPPSQQPLAACNLPWLDYYLTFIHYFGFSINPNDDTNSRYLSFRVKRAATFASSMRLHRQNQRMRKQTSGGTEADLGDDPETGSDDSLAERRNQSEVNPQNQSQTSLPVVSSHKCRKRLRLTVKFLAIALTSFLAFNHLVVLIEYVRQGSKMLTELMLEMRLVITKFSALIFVASWHRNQARVRQLLRLVKSTSVNILARETSGTGPQMGVQITSGRQGVCANQNQLQAGGENPRLKSLNRRILAWWLMCTSITVIHFSLSEAEIKTAHHLWEWLDDYSLHTLSNATTSKASLLAMASFDNYIYTVHVYGTRLIGASIICIVCSFQIENIDCLTRQALSLLQASQTAHMRVHDNTQTQGKPQAKAPKHHHNNNNNNSQWSWWWPTIWGSLDSVLGGGGVGGGADPRRQLAGATGGQLKLDWAQQRQLCKSFYVLGESDWLQVERERHRLEPLGWLSSTLSARLTQLGQVVVGALGLAGRCVSLTKSLVQRWRQSISFGASTPRRIAGIKNRVTPFGPGRLFRAAWGRSGSQPGKRAAKSELADQREANPTRPTNSTGGALPEFMQIPRADSHDRATAGASTLRDYFNDYLARERARATRTGNAEDDHDHEKITQSGRSERKHGQQLSPLLPSGQEVELQLDSLARKYELIRTVNLRIDTCFGHILLSQYLFLFLMSCIDVVFFSLSFSTNTKTKYIIVSGMILLWLPYLLLYRFASDIGLASERLLTSVRRLARLALVLQLSAGGDLQTVAGGCGRTETSQPAAGNSLAGLGQKQVAVISGDDKLENWSTWSQEDNLRSCASGRPSGGLGFWPASTLWHYRHLFCRQPLAVVDSLASSKREDCHPSPVILDCATATSQVRVQSGQAKNRATTRRMSQANLPPVAKAHNVIISDPRTTSGPSCSSRARIFNKLDHVFKPSHLSIVGIMTMNKFFLLDFAKIVITASVMTIQFITKR